jgi:hypothetical protein
MTTLTTSEMFTENCGNELKHLREYMKIIHIDMCIGRKHAHKKENRRKE